MAITHLSLVNQKLAYAKATLSLATDDNLGRLQQQALVDACVFHLVSAYRFYLRELGENYRVKNLMAINDSKQLMIALSALDKAPSEATELVTLEAEAQSWLAQLLAYFESLQQSPTVMKEAKAFVSDELIQAVDITNAPTEPSPPPTANDLTAALDNFRQLVQRQRETSAEY